MKLITQEIDTYIKEHSSEENPLLIDLVKTTYEKMKIPQMTCFVSE